MTKEKKRGTYVNVRTRVLRAEIHLNIRHTRSSRDENKIREDFEDKGELGPEPFSPLKHSVSSFTLERDSPAVSSILLGWLEDVCFHSGAWGAVYPHHVVFSSVGPAQCWCCLSNSITPACNCLSLCSHRGKGVQPGCSAASGGPSVGLIVSLLALCVPQRQEELGLDVGMSYIPGLVLPKNALEQVTGHFISSSKK